MLGVISQAGLFDALLASEAKVAVGAVFARAADTRRQPRGGDPKLEGNKRRGIDIGKIYLALPGLL